MSNHPSDEDLSLGTPVKREISTPRTKTYSWGPRTLGHPLSCGINRAQTQGAFRRLDLSPYNEN